jgi:NitT/TauT family transport system substrate-binding protein
MDDARIHQTRRRSFLVRSSALVAASLLGVHRMAAAEPPPEITRIRLTHSPAICLAPQYLAEELLRIEGFSDIEYVKLEAAAAPELVQNGLADMFMWDVPGILPTLDAGQPLIVLSGVHAGCYELIGNDDVETVRDLKGKTVAVQLTGSGDQILISSILAYVGMDPRTDVRWIAGAKFGEAMDLFVAGKADAFMGFAPQPQELRRKNIGHVLVNTAEDPPWSQYYCCAVVANRGYAERYPVATKRALRAFLKAADICAEEPERVARYLVKQGFEPRYDIGVEVLRSLPYNRWREANIEDTIRFHALRLHEVGMIKSTPQQIIERGSNSSFLNELKKELKA